MSNAEPKSIAALAAEYDAASLAFDRAHLQWKTNGAHGLDKLEELRAARNLAETALLMAQRAAS